MNEQNKAYLGDGLYAHFDGFQIWLTTQQGMEVALEPAVQDAFLRYLGKVNGCKITVTYPVEETIHAVDPDSASTP